MPVNSFENYPMSWKPKLYPESKRPIYIELSELLQKDVVEGKLLPGTKLPPQRELADYLDINLSTVTRAFKLCEQKGLLCSVVGRGTFVASDVGAREMLVIHKHDEHIIEMGPILPNPDINEITSTYLRQMTAEPDFYKLLQYAPVEYDNLQIMAASRWFSYMGVKSNRKNTIFSIGSQNGLFAALASLFKEGDRIATTAVTYPGLKVAANILGIQVVPLPNFDGKITEESLAYVHKNHDVKGYYFIPDFNNPSSEQLDINTRKNIAAYCDKHDLFFIEDNIYTLFQDSPLPPITTFSDDHGILISSVSKIMSPGLRLAVLKVPTKYHELISTTLYAMEITPPSLMMQLFTRLVNSGEFEKIRALRIAELKERNTLFDKICHGFNTSGNKYSPIRWIRLKENDSRTPAHLEQELMQFGVRVYAADRFVVGNTQIPKAIRVSLISEHSTDNFTKGLEILTKVLKNIPGHAFEKPNIL